MCRAHINRNAHALVAQLGTKALEHPDRVPGEITGVTVAQFLEDLQDLEWIIKRVPHDGQAQLDALAVCYQMAPPSDQDHRASMLTRHHAPPSPTS